jgi:hypothetical protein
MNKEWIDGKTCLLFFTSEEVDIIQTINWRWFGGKINKIDWFDTTECHAYFSKSELTTDLWEIASNENLSRSFKEEMMKIYISLA